MKKVFLAMIAAVAFIASATTTTLGAVRDIEGEELEDGIYTVFYNYQTIDDNSVFLEIDDNGFKRTIQLGPEYESLSDAGTYRIRIQEDDIRKVFAYALPADIR